MTKVFKSACQPNQSCPGDLDWTMTSRDRRCPSLAILGLEFWAPPGHRDQGCWGEGQLLVDGRSAKTPQKKSVLWGEILNFDWRAGMVDCCPSFHRLAKAGIAEKICCWWGPSPHPTHYCGNTWDPLTDLSHPTSIFLLPLQVFARLSQFPRFINNQQRGWAGVLWRLMLR